MQDIVDLLTDAVAKKASDIHLTVGVPPVLRLNGSLVRYGDEILRPDDTLNFFHRLADEDNIACFKE